jgi:hypothetical protein
MDKVSLKYQVFNHLCLSNLEFSSPQEFMELFQQATDYIGEGATFDEDTRQTNLNLVN